MQVPTSLIAERARVCAVAESAWEAARASNDFAALRPHLEEVVRLTRELAACLDPARLYQALLEEYEPGMTTAALDRLFEELRPALAGLLTRVQACSPASRPGPLRGHFPVDRQQAFCRRLVAEMGFDLQAGRLDRSAHPFTAGTLRDVRITTRYDEAQLAAGISGALHEAGHGLYEQGLDPSRYRHPAGPPSSLGLHESQSRFWENLIGRSRAFWQHYLPVLREHFPEALEGASADQLFGAANLVQPSLIRVDADELTYNFHIMLRYRLERALIEEQLQVAELPALWREGMIADLGLTPPDDRQGVLQDIHWPAGLIGYFPTYTLGNLYAAQLATSLRRDLPDLDGLVERGELTRITAWLREKVHRQGSLQQAPELCRQVTGRPVEVQPFLDYLEGKLTVVYGI